MTSPYELKLPDVGEGVTEAEIAEWHVKVGDQIEEDQPLVDVMTDKVTVEIPSPATGVVTAINHSEGEVVAVGAVIVVIAADGSAPVAAEKPANDAVVEKAEAAEPAKAEEKAPTPESKPREEPVKAPSEPANKPVSEPRPITSGSDEPLAAPATRKKAYDLGIPLQFVPATGPGGRITEQDLDDYIASGGSESVSMGPKPRVGISEVKILGMRKKIAERMQDSKSRIPHFSYVDDVDMTVLEALRAQMNAERSETAPKLSLLPFFMKAIVKLQSEFPNMNSRFDDENNLLRVYDGVHIGIATMTKVGLMVPVVKHVEALSIWECASEMLRVTSAAKDGKATMDELTGSTITITSLGPLAGITTTPVINSPEVAIVGPNKLDKRPVVGDDGSIQVRTMMNLSSSFDHRIIDGYDAALFINRMKRLLENPALLFVEDSK